MLMEFSKYQALGNSFIILHKLFPDGKAEKFARIALKICNQREGVGADGLLVVSEISSRYRVDIYNADGSWAEKSGNGVRIAAMHLLNAGKIAGAKTFLETGSGQSTVAFHRGNQQQRIVSASLGVPIFEALKIPVLTSNKYFINQPVKYEDDRLLASAVSVGNPHLIIFCQNFEFDWQSIGRSLETHKLFPHRINVGFVVAQDDNHIEVRDWERGAGPTLSSGTGAAAAVAISVVRGFTSRAVDVKTQAGVLGVIWDEKTDELIIKGPVEFIASGKYNV